MWGRTAIEQADEQRCIPVAASRNRAQAAYAAPPRRAWGARGAPTGGGRQRKAASEGIPGSEGTGTDPLWRLGKQGHRLGLLNPARLLLKQQLSQSRKPTSACNHDGCSDRNPLKEVGDVGIVHA